MIKIGYCDDREKDRHEIERLFRYIEGKWEERIEISAFSNGVELYESTKKENYDLLIIDLLMEEIDGIETASRIRAIGMDIPIIFISNYVERVRELFDFQAIAFLEKPIQIDKLEKALKKAYEMNEKSKERIFTYIQKNVVNYIPLKQIVYFESRRNIVVMHTRDSEEFFYDTLSNTWEKIRETGQFIMPSKSFIFNLSYVTLGANSIELKHTSESYNIGKKYKKDTEDRYLKYMEERYRVL